MDERQHADGRAGIDAGLVTRLVARQFPQWRHLAVRPVDQDGWDNRTYRLGADMSVRLPTAAPYAGAVDKEHRWLPVLARSLPVAVPTSLAVGEPGEGYPFPWSVRGWLTGRPARPSNAEAMVELAIDVARFLGALRRIDTADGPDAGAHSFFRGADLAHYDAETRAALVRFGGRLDTARIDPGAIIARWEAALAAPWSGPAVWFHGDVAAGNLLVADGRLSAVIDFGTCGVGDPAGDLVIAWTLFSGHSRAVFRDAVGQDAGMWARARGWALWKALISLPEDPEDDPAGLRANLRVISAVLADAGPGGHP